jgi:hypothetical protein
MVLADAESAIGWKCLLSSAFTSCFNVVDHNFSSREVYLQFLDVVHIQYREFVSLFKAIFTVDSSHNLLGSTLLLIYICTKFIVVDENVNQWFWINWFSFIFSESNYSELIPNIFRCYNETFGLVESFPINSNESSRLIFYFLRSLLSLDEIYKLSQTLLEFGTTVKSQEQPRLLLIISILLDGTNLSVPSSCNDETPSTNGDFLNLYESKKVRIRQIIVRSLEWRKQDMEDSLSLSNFVEKVTQSLIRDQLLLSYYLTNPCASFKLMGNLLMDDSIAFRASAPVRIDLAGGWSDTPPICYDQAGSVSYLDELIYLNIQ